MKLKSFIRRASYFLPKTQRQFAYSIFYATKIALGRYKLDRESLFFSKFIRQGDCVFDIGANIGVYTKYLSKIVGNNGQVISLEPIPTTFKHLLTTIRVMGLENVSPYNVAISSDCGRKRMIIPKNPNGLPNIYQAQINDKITEGYSDSYTIKCLTIDTFLSSINRDVSFIKCDIEGHELDFFLGAQNLIRKFYPTIFIEISQDPAIQNSNANKLFYDIQKLGYKIFLLEENKLNSWTTNSPKAVNYFFIHNAKLNELNQKYGEPVISN